MFINTIHKHILVIYCRKAYILSELARLSSPIEEVTCNMQSKSVLQ